MASLTTYLLVSGVDAPRDLEGHPALESYDVETYNVTDDEDGPSRVTLVHESDLEDRVDLSDAARALSAAFPDASVVLSVVEERFDHVERLKTVLYRGGNTAGRIEHGYVFNVGQG
ncbi:MAG: hypothetical protein ABEL97_00140 [Salinibacter sp.]